MVRRRLFLVRALVVAVAAWTAAWPARPTATRAIPLPERLSDQEFWKIITDYSEPSGTFHSENLVSNEARFQGIVPSLVERAVQGRAYVGVGSEQNFTYIAALHPDVAFIVDLRRGNLDLHLAYKALFEMSADRADFVSHLFSKARPAGLGAGSTADQIFAAYERVPSSRALYDQNLKAIETRLASTHGFALSDGDRDGLSFVYGSWFEGGPDLRYQLNTGFGGRGMGFPTYADLMTATDGAGQNRSYLATEDNFRFLKDLETRNMLVPVVGNFGGPKALRAVGAWLKAHDQIVSAYYLSNVEQYLRQDGLWEIWCANTATLPLDRTSTFIRSQSGAGGFALSLGAIQTEVGACGAGR